MARRRTGGGLKALRFGNGRQAGGTGAVLRDTRNARRTPSTGTGGAIAGSNQARVREARCMPRGATVRRINQAADSPKEPGTLLSTGMRRGRLLPGRRRRRSLWGGDPPPLDGNGRETQIPADGEAVLRIVQPSHLCTKPPRYFGRGGAVPMFPGGPRAGRAATAPGETAGRRFRGPAAW